MSKYRFGIKRIPFLKHVISDQGLETEDVKVEAVREWPLPKNVKQIQKFIGFCGYYRRFVKDFSKIAKPLTELTKKSE